MNKALTLITVLIVASPLGLAAAFSHSTVASNDHILYQVSTLDALLAGDYEAKESIGELRSHGDTGLGTFEALDGEMIVLEGVVYRAAYDGTVEVVPESENTSYACMTWFESESSLSVPSGWNLSVLGTMLLSTMNSTAFYAIEISGVFSEVTVRSVPRQQEPYPPLDEVLQYQSVSTLANVSGTLVGFYSPQCAGTIDSPGFHFHFISDDRSSGGHVLGLGTLYAQASLDRMVWLEIDLG